MAINPQHNFDSFIAKNSRERCSQVELIAITKARARCNELLKSSIANVFDHKLMLTFIDILQMHEWDVKLA